MVVSLNSRLESNEEEEEGEEQKRSGVRHAPSDVFLTFDEGTNRISAET